MKTVTSMLMTVTLALLALPALAQPLQQADDVTKTFQLTITGEVPPRTAFSVRYGDQANRDVLYLCGPFEGTPDCSISAIPTDDGTVVHFVDITWPRGAELHVTWRVHPGGVEAGTAFHEGVETLHSDTTNTAAYTFGATAPATPTPAPPADAVDVHFRLTVTGGPCPTATYFAVFGVPQGEFFSEQLTDPEGDGVYTLSRALGANPLYISIQQGIGTVQAPPSLSPLPGQPRSTIRDFGLITPTQDMTFEARVAGCPAGAPVSGAPGEQPVHLPDTGASYDLPAALLAGGLLLIGGVYLRRRMLQQA